MMQNIRNFDDRLAEMQGREELEFPEAQELEVQEPIEPDELIDGGY